MFTGEQRPRGESAEVAGLAIAIEKRELVPVTSALSRVEVLQCNLTETAKGCDESSLRQPKVQIKDVTTPILNIATEIREYYQTEKDAGRSNLPTIEAPDAIHLATTIYYECLAFYTFDETDRPTETRQKRA